MTNTLRLFIDCEFTNFIKCDLISIGVAADNGAEFYGENLDFNRKLSSEWVVANVYPLLTPVTHGMKRSELSARLWSWIDELPCNKVIITVDYQTDFDLLFDLFDDELHPKMLPTQNVFSEI